MSNLKKFTTAFLAVGVISACNINSVVDDINQATVDAAFDTIKLEAESKGGAAGKVTRGKEVTIEVTSPESLIFGATVKVPADALPADVDLATVSIFYAPLLEANPGALGIQGNGAKVTLTKLPGGEEVLPVGALTISLPVTKDSTKPIEKIVLATVHADTGALVAVEGGASDAAKKHAVGVTKGLSMPFVAGWLIEYDGGAADPDTFIYKVTTAGATTCLGRGRINHNAMLAGITESSGYYKFDLSFIGGGGSIAQSGVSLTPFGLPATAAAGTVSVPPDNTFVVQCLAGSYAYPMFHDIFTLTLSKWVESSQTPAAAAGTVHNGSVMVTGEFDFTSSGARVQGAFNVVKPGFNWYTNP